ncbi:MAG: stage II sporulation protein P [Lachnospiraceae bacterium]
MADMCKAGYRKVISCAGLLAGLLIIAGNNGKVKFFLPLFSYEATDCAGSCLMEEDESTSANIIYYLSGTTGEEGSRTEDDAEEHLTASGDAVGEAGYTAISMEELRLENEAVGTFKPHEKQNTIDFQAYTDYETLLKTFYTIDSNALAGSDLFNIEDLLEWDFKLEKDDAAPQILIYHTHSKEAFADSRPGEREDTIVGVGDELARILSEDYGYCVLHNTAEYDTVRDEAYGNSLPEITKLLEKNPSIQVVIDLHRDAGSKGRENTQNIDGRNTARFMFFNGISRSRKTGDITYLANPNLKGNLAFSFQMQAACEEYYPGLTRKIYIKQYRFNMHLRERTLLIELGDENNTVEEAKNACYPIAHVLNMVLSGQAP